MDVTRRQAEIFLKIVQTGGFLEAAREINISQAAVTKAVAALEAKLGCRLFERARGKRTTLAPGGREFMPRAIAMMEAYEGANMPVWPLDEREDFKLVRIAAGDFMMEIYLKPALNEFYRLFPNVELQIEMRPTSIDAARSARREGFDIGFFTIPDYLESSEAKRLATVEGGLYATPDVVSGHDAWQWGRTQSLPVIMMARSGQGGMNLTRLLSDAGFSKITVVARAPNFAVMRELGMGGVGAFMLQHDQAAPFVADKRLIALGDLPNLYRYAFPYSQDPLANRICSFFSERIASRADPTIR